MGTIVGKRVNSIGYGMGSLTSPHKSVSTADAIAVLKTALEAGANCWNAGLIYGTSTYNSCHLLNAYFTQYPSDVDRVCVSVKGCFDLWQGKIFNDADSVRASIDEALRVIDGKCKIDIFEPCRVDPRIPIEETVGAIAEYVRAGKVGGIGLSECGAGTIRRAMKVHPIAAVEIEISLISTEAFTNGITQTCRDYNIPIIAYSPLGHGFLTGQIRRLDDIPQSDYRRMFPRFQPDAFADNIRLVEEVKAIAQKKGCSEVQIAIAWVAAQSEKAGVPIIPIPGSSNLPRTKENTSHIKLEKSELTDIEDILRKIEVKGGRAPGKFAHLLNG
ncbi:putative aldo/keto reductase [Polychaeton citri CBS 116435]|uniref:Aldo/keto reductase n=1 Tax=Polychaeton citri CBS 116435 TaxID=1314669 RepID=A0A9P4Q9I9_9PEZI|nr:putative aldo/keto reductase [Polychaeton citri CBS 116435]